MGNLKSSFPVLSNKIVKSSVSQPLGGLQGHLRVCDKSLETLLSRKIQVFSCGVLEFHHVALLVFLSLSVFCFCFGHAACGILVP